MCFCYPYTLFLVPQYRVAMFACTNAPCVDHVAYKDAPIANLARVSSFDDDFYRRLHKLVAANNGQRNTLNDICRILDATIDAFLSALADAMFIVILKPINVRRK